MDLNQIMDLNKKWTWIQKMYVDLKIHLNQNLTLIQKTDHNPKNGPKLIMDLNNGSKCKHTIFHFDFIFVSSVFQGCGSWHHWSDLLMLMFINVGHNSICISLLLSLQRCDKNTVDEASLAQKVINYYILKKMENYMDFVINRISQQNSIKIQFFWEISFDEKLVLVIIQFCWEITFADK